MPQPAERRVSLQERQEKDHDLLVEIRVKTDALIEKVDKFIDNTVSRIDNIESQISAWKELTKLRDAQAGDFDGRIRFLEKWVWGAIAVIAFIQIAVTVYLTYKGVK